MIFFRTYCFSIDFSSSRSSYIISLSYLLRQAYPILFVLYIQLYRCLFFSPLLFFVFFVCRLSSRQTCSMRVYGLRLKQYLVETITCFGWIRHNILGPVRAPCARLHTWPQSHIRNFVTSYQILMAFFTNEPIAHNCHVGNSISHPPPIQLSYTIAGCSEHSNRFVAENIMVDLPSDPNSRWSGLHENPSIKQWILLRLDTLSVIGEFRDSLAWSNY